MGPDNRGATGTGRDRDAEGIKGVGYLA